MSKRERKIEGLFWGYGWIIKRSGACRRDDHDLVEPEAEEAEDPEVRGLTGGL
jgi:hypothetical protein